MHVVARANWTCLKDFFWRGKLGGRRKERERTRVISEPGERQRPRIRGRERNPVILFIMHSHGERRMG